MRSRFSLALAIGLLLPVGKVQGANESVIANFVGTYEGTGPFSSLVVDKKGNLFGTTSVDEGKFGMGFVFELSPPVVGSNRWTNTNLHNFDGANGNQPFSSPLIIDDAGNLYGTTIEGGAHKSGTVYRLSPPSPAHSRWTETVLHSFNGNDGNEPFGVTMDAAGNLYGTTFSGGSRGNGTIFKLIPPARGSAAWTLATLYNFQPSLSNPFAGVILDKAGNLYGTARGGSIGGVFRLSPPANGGVTWTFTSLHKFKGGAAKGPAAGLVFDAAGNLYGTTSGDGKTDHGMVFRLTPPVRGSASWTFKTLHSFNGTDGDFVGGGSLVLDAAGNIYGTTDGAEGTGNVFMLSPPATGKTIWRETVLHTFPAGGTSDGCFPWGGVIFDRSGKNIYGTTQGCGTRIGGTAYEITLP